MGITEFEQMYNLNFREAKKRFKNSRINTERWWNPECGITGNYRVLMQKLVPHLGKFEVEAIEDAFWRGDLDSKLEMLDILGKKVVVCGN